MRIAIVGATGNIGTALLRRLHAERESGPEPESGPGRESGPDSGSGAGVESVVGIARRAPTDGDEAYEGVQWHEIDISRDDATGRLTEAFAGVDTVVHLAWAIQPSHDEAFQRRVDVRGTEAALAAAAAAGVSQVVVASSVGAYSTADKSLRIDESWPTGGLHTSTYSLHKASDERLYDRFERAHPDIVLTRMRPGLVFQRGAATEIAGLFLGPRYPVRLLGRIRTPVVPLPSAMIFQAVHADDVADAFWRSIARRAGGAFNLASDPVLTPELLAGAVGAKPLTVPIGLLRGLVSATWRLRIQRTDAGWIDIATKCPVMSTERARMVLGWEPRVRADDALRELLSGLADRSTVAGSGPLRGRR